MCVCPSQKIIRFNSTNSSVNSSHSYPKWEYKIKNVSEVCYIFLKSKLYDNSKKYFLKIFGLGPSPLTPISFETSILEKNVRKLFFNFRGGLLSKKFSKNLSKCLKTVIFLLKAKSWYFVTKVSRHFEWFFEKNSFKRYRCQGAWP